MEFSCNLLNMLTIGPIFHQWYVCHDEYVFIFENVQVSLFHMENVQNFKSY
jgi:hypothetical protein